jgi:predicted metal-dependent HD superfamily phosphohydrolase
VTLPREWSALLRRVHGSGDIDGTGERLLRRWNEPHRRYHDVDHLTAVLKHADRLAAHAEDPDAVRLAAWYHDAIYGGASTDETASAQLAAEELAALHIDPALIAEVARLIRLTATHDPAPGDRNGEVLCDADLAVLASLPDAYDAYARAVRAEYGHVDDPGFRAGRARLLRTLLTRPTLFRTPYGRDHWEATARENIERELARLTSGEPPFPPPDAGKVVPMTIPIRDPEPARPPRREEEALETGEVYQDAEGRRTTDAATAAEHADSEAKRTARHLARGEVGPGIPEE